MSRWLPAILPTQHTISIKIFVYPYSLNILPSTTMYRGSRLSSLLPYLIKEANRMQYCYFQPVNKPALKYKHQEIISTTMTTKVRLHKNCMLSCKLFNSVTATIAFEKAFLYFSLKFSFKCIKLRITGQVFCYKYTLH